MELGGNEAYLTLMDRQKPRGGGAGGSLRDLRVRSHTSNYSCSAVTQELPIKVRSVFLYLGSIKRCALQLPGFVAKVEKHHRPQLGKPKLPLPTPLERPGRGSSPGGATY